MWWWIIAVGSALSGAILRRRQPDESVAFCTGWPMSLPPDGGKWKTTHSFRRNDLLVLAKVAD